VTRSFEAHEDPALDSVWLWFEFQLELIGEERGRLMRSFHSDSDNENKRNSRYIGLTRTEVEELFDAQRGQLELLTMFELLATTEAILRIDFKARVTAKKRDLLSRHFRQLYRENGDRIRLDEDILTALKDHGVPANIVSAMRGALKLRHWLAHGRHWHPKLGRGYAPGDVFDITKALIVSLPPY
jgi:hypothetical protein